MRSSRKNVKDFCVSRSLRRALAQKTETATGYLEIFIVGYSMFTNCLYCLQNFDLKRTHKSRLQVNTL